MKTRARKLAAVLLLSGCVFVTGTGSMPVSAAAVTAEATQGVDFSSTITEMDAAGNQVLVYYPTPNAAETLGVKTTCTAPVFLVFGDGAYSQEEAIAFAQESGLAALAAANGSSVCFVNPKGETWTDEDADSYGAVAQMVGDSSSDPVIDGILHGVNFMTKEETLSISGSQSRLYVYGIGSGADFAAKHILKKVEAPTAWGGTANVTAAGCTVEGLTDASEVEKNDIPVVSIGAAEEVNAVLEEVCGSVLKEDTADYLAEFAAVIGNNRRQAGVLLPVHDYEAEGITEVIESTTVATSEDNPNPEFKSAKEHVINYVTYYADDLDVKNGNVPLVLCFHGGGNTALYEAQATEWPQIGKEHGFMTVSVDLHHPDATATEIVELIDFLKTEYSIDESRIYASGFSMGGCKSWDLFEQYPEIFAGLAPMDATQVPGLDSFDNPVENTNTDVITPVFYVGGEASPLPELPFQEVKVVDRISGLFAVNEVVTSYDVDFEKQDSWENKIWGINGDLTYSVTDQTAFKDSTLNVNLFQSEDGRYYTACASASNQSHEVYARNSWAAWDFLSQFSRNEEGSIDIEPVVYSLSADDGSITDNSYNTAE